MPLDKALLERIANDDLNLKVLSVSDSKLGEEDIAHLVRALKTNTSITHIDFSNQTLGDAGIAQLAAVLKSKAEASLVSLNLSNTGITDKGLMSILPLLGSAGLGTLILQKNKISTSGAELLTKQLQDQRNEITTLDLEGNEITTSAMAAVQSKIKENREIFINLLKAIQSGDIENLQSILSMGVVLNQFSTQGYTPLMLAIIAGKLPIIEQLLNLNVSLDDACLNEKNRNKTVFDFAKESSNPEILKLLYKVAYQRQLARIKKQADTISQEQNRLVRQVSLIDRKSEDKTTDISSSENKAHEAQKGQIEEQQQEIIKLNQQIVRLQKDVESNKTPPQKLGEDSLKELLAVISELKKGQEDLAKQIYATSQEIKDTVVQESNMATLTIIADTRDSAGRIMAHQEQLTKQLINHNVVLNTQVRGFLEKQNAEQKELIKQTTIIIEQMANLKAIQEVCVKLADLPQSVTTQIEQLNQHFTNLTQLNSDAAIRQKNLVEIIQNSATLLEQLQHAIKARKKFGAKLVTVQAKEKDEKVSSDVLSEEQTQFTIFQQRVTFLQALLSANITILYSMYDEQQSEVSKNYDLIIAEQRKLATAIGNHSKDAEQSRLQVLLASMAKFQDQLPKLRAPIEQLQNALVEVSLTDEQTVNEGYFSNYLQNSLEDKLVTTQLTPQQLGELAKEISKFLNEGVLPKAVAPLGAIIDKHKKESEVLQKLDSFFALYYQENKENTNDNTNKEGFIETKNISESKGDHKEYNTVSEDKRNPKRIKVDVEKILTTKLRFNDPHLEKFYSKLKVRLEDFYAEAKLLSTGQISPKARNTEKTTDALKLAADFIPIPYVSLVTNLIGGMVTKLAEEEALSDAELTHKFFTALHESGTLSSDYIISEVAYHITWNYQAQILKLTDKGSDQLALSATKRMLGFIASLDEKDVKDEILKKITPESKVGEGDLTVLKEKLAAAKIELIMRGAISSMHESKAGDADIEILKEKIALAKIGILMRGIIEGPSASKFKNTGLECSDKKDENWTVEGLFKRPGLQLEDGSRYVINPPKTFFERKNAMRSRPEKYGYRLGTAEDKLRYKYNKQVVFPAPAKLTTVAATLFNGIDTDVVVRDGITWHGEHKRSPAAESVVVAAKPRAPA